MGVQEGHGLVRGAGGDVGGCSLDNGVHGEQTGVWMELGRMQTGMG